VVKISNSGLLYCLYKLRILRRPVVVTFCDPKYLQIYTVARNMSVSRVKRNRIELNTLHNVHTIFCTSSRNPEDGVVGGKGGGYFQLIAMESA
jgi:hypothetical protein